MTGDCEGDAGIATTSLECQDQYVAAINAVSVLAPLSWSWLTIVDVVCMVPLKPLVFIRFVVCMNFMESMDFMDCIKIVNLMKPKERVPIIDLTKSTSAVWECHRWRSHTKPALGVWYPWAPCDTISRDGGRKREMGFGG